MPKIEIDYSNTIIYKITCNDNTITDTYVGHTTNFVQRKHTHKNSCSNEKSPNYNCKLYKTIRQHGGWSNWKIEIVNFFNCNDQNEAKQKEQEYFELLNANLNSVEPLSNKINTQPYDNNQSSPIEINHDNTSIIENCSKQIIPNNATDNILPAFECKICDYKCSIKFSFNRHLITPKHIKLSQIQKEKEKDKLNHICECGQVYCSRTTLWRHKKICNYAHDNKCYDDKLKEIPSTKEIIDLMRLQIIENQELTKIMIEQQKQIIELASKISISQIGS
jgi:hypothetical protein